MCRPIRNRSGANGARSADYIVAVVESTPVTNREVNLRADLIAHDLTARHAAVPERAALLKQALNDLILRKAAISFELLHFLKVWLTKHISETDKRFGSHFLGVPLAADWSPEVEAAMNSKKAWWRFW